MAHDRVSLLVGVRILAVVLCVFRLRILLLRVRLRVSLAANVYNDNYISCNLVRTSPVRRKITVKPYIENGCLLVGHIGVAKVSISGLHGRVN